MNLKNAKKVCIRIPYILEKRCMNIPFNFILVFLIVNLLFFFFLTHLFIRIIFVLISYVVLKYLGKLPLVDFDPVPFFTSIIFVFYGFFMGLEFAMFTIPVVDAVVARFNQWTLINLFSIILSLLLISFFKSGLLFSMLIILFVYNLLRLIIALFLGFREVAVTTPLFNLLFYSFISYIFFPFLQKIVEIF
jgi:hypothetical protein